MLLKTRKLIYLDYTIGFKLEINFLNYFGVKISLSPTHKFLIKLA